MFKDVILKIQKKDVDLRKIILVYYEQMTEKMFPLTLIRNVTGNAAIYVLLHDKYMYISKMLIPANIIRE